MSDVLNQLSYVAIFFFRDTLSALRAHYAYRALQRQPLFQGKLLEVTVWLGCEQRGAIFVNYCLLVFFPHPTAILLSYRMKFGIHNSGGKLIYEILARCNRTGQDRYACISATTSVDLLREYYARFMTALMGALLLMQSAFADRSNRKSVNMFLAIVGRKALWVDDADRAESL